MVVGEIWVNDLLNICFGRIFDWEVKLILFGVVSEDLSLSLFKKEVFSAGF